MRPTQEDRLEVTAIEDALSRLPDDQRQVVLLVGLEEMSYQEAASVLAIPIGTVMSRLHRGARAPARGADRRRRPAAAEGQMTQTPKPIGDEELHAYADGQLDAARREAIDAWLADHPEDAARVNVYTRINMALHERFDTVLRRADPGGDDASAAAAALDDAPPGRRRGGVFDRRAWSAAGSRAKRRCRSRAGARCRPDDRA